MAYYIIIHFDSEKLEEDGAFPKQELAALLVSKVYFHLGSYLDSLTYALRSGPMLHQDPNQLYIDTIKGNFYIYSYFFFLLVNVRKLQPVRIFI